MQHVNWAKFITELGRQAYGLRLDTEQLSQHQSPQQEEALWMRVRFEWGGTHILLP